MVMDKVSRWLLAGIAAAVLAIGASVFVDAVRPEPAQAEDWYVELGSICNVGIVGERPWCAQVFSVGGSVKALGVVDY